VNVLPPYRRVLSRYFSFIESIFSYITAFKHRDLAPLREIGCEVVLGAIPPFKKALLNVENLKLE
jgi:hypothetical protein